MKTKACALLVAIIMLFSFMCPAENGYVTISDPYYTDGENVYDLTGLSANLSFAKAENVIQLILRAITAYEQTAAGIEIENEVVSLYADGFAGRYTMSLNDLMMLLGEATYGNFAINTSIDALLLSNQENKAAAEVSLKKMISEIYDAIYADGSILAGAKAGTVDTFLHSSMSAFVVPIDMTAEEMDAQIASFASMMDEDESLVNFLNGYVMGDPYAAENGEAVIAPKTFVSLYEEVVKPLNLSVKGNAYFGEDDIFIEWNLMSGEEAVIPVFMEVTNAENPSLYMNVQMNDKMVVYATIESGKNDYLEIGVLEDERTIALVTYQVYENAGMPVQDYYVGLAYGNALYNFSFVNSTDNETARNIHASAYLDGMEIQLSYTGAISSDYGDRNEQGSIQLATNFGIRANVNVGFGTGTGEPVEFIPAEIPVKDIVAMNDEENQLMMLDFGNLVNKLTTSLIMGVPGFAEMVGMDGAEG